MTMEPETFIFTKIRHPEYFFWAAVVLFLFSFVREEPTIAASDIPSAATVAHIPAKTDPFQSLAIEAGSAHVLDTKTGKVLFSKQATSTRALASITKVMTAAVALSLIPDTTLIPIKLEAIEEEGDSGLKAGERWLLRDLVALMLVESSNDAARAISSSVGSYALGTEDNDAGRAHFIAQMNERAREWNLRDTIFRSESGLDISVADEEPPSLPGAISTARDTAHLMAYAIENFPSVFTATRWSEFLVENGAGEVRNARNTNKETDKLPLLLASKTGFTDLAGGNLVVAFDAGFGHPIIVVVLGSTAEGRFSDVEKLVWATLESLASR